MKRKMTVWYMSLAAVVLFFLLCGWGVWKMIVTPKMVDSCYAFIDREKVPFDDTWTVTTEDPKISTAKIIAIQNRKTPYVIAMDIYTDARHTPNTVILTDPDGNVDSTLQMPSVDVDQTVFRKIPAAGRARFTR